MDQFLNSIKSSIEKTYRIDSGIKDINQFLLKEEKYKEILDKITNKVKSSIDAKVLIYEEDDGFDLGLYFSDEFRKAYDDNFDGILDDKNIDILRTVIEEVDHLIMLGYSITHEKPTTLLELETQANITNYILISEILTEDPLKDNIPIKNYIFSRVFDEKDAEVNNRYEKAIQLSKAFIDNLHKKNDDYEKLTNLREFYRFIPQKKLEYLTKETGIII